MTITAVPARAQHLIPKFDPAAEKARILAGVDLAELDDILLMGNRILVAKWIRDKEGSIITTAQTKAEDGFQSKVGLVLKVGPLAFTDDANHQWFGQEAKVGDWVLYSYSDGHDFEYRTPGTYDRVKCKILEEQHIQMILPRPDFAY